MTPTLILFDIDGTLVLTGRAGLRGMNEAFRRLYGAPNVMDQVSFAGRTDRAIVADALAAIGREPTDANMLAVRDAYCACLRDEIRRPTEHPSLVLPGVEAALASLARQPEVTIGLLTGNFVSGAEIKLGHFDLWRRFTFGAFGDDHHDRRALVPIALDRARALGHAPFAPERVVIIGDTPLDVDCAKANGARAIAVATGPYDVATLAAAGADVTLRDMTHLTSEIWPGGHL